MEQAAEALDFEQAAALRDRLRAIAVLGKTQRVIAGVCADTDVWGLYRGQVRWGFGVLHLEGGNLLGREVKVLPAGAEEDEGEILSAVLRQYYEGRSAAPKEICVAALPEDSEALEEMLTVARTLDIPVHISHLKAMGRDNWGKKIPQALEMLAQARREGLDVSCDVYPYTAGSTQLLHILPPDYLTGGPDAVTERLKDPAVRKALAERIKSGAGFDNIAGLAGWDGIYLTSLHRRENHIYQGKSLAEIGRMMGKAPLEACCDLLVSEHCEITMIDFMASEDDIAAILRDEKSNLISDATYPTEGQLHPRVYGAFTHLLTRFVREKGTLSVEEAVHKMTQGPAQALRIQGKGCLAVGMDADINVFALHELNEPGTYEDPCRLAQGMRYVIVNGVVALEDGQITGARAGQVIRRKET